MINIPEKLEKFRFIKINPSDENPKTCKKPLEMGWTKNKNYSKKEIELQNVNKYGVLCGYNGLVVIDCDSKEFQDKALESTTFQNTFTTKTAMKGLYHFYFQVDKDKPETKRLDKNSVRIADIQGVGTQVIGPSSKLLGKEYKIVNDTLIRKITYDSLIKFCQTILPDIDVTSTKREKKRKEKPLYDKIDEEHDPVIAFIKSKLTMRDLLEDCDISTTKGKNSECPFHTSVSGQCLSHDDHQYYCFHCNRGGSMFDFYMELKNISFVDAKNRLAEKVGVPESIINEAKRLIKKSERAKATELMVNRFYKNNSVYTIRNDLKPEMWIYKNGIYAPHAKTHIKNHCRVLTGDFYTSPIANQVISKVETDTTIDEEDFFNVKYTNLICVQNGILNVITNEIIPFSPDKIFFNKFPVYYDPSKIKMPNITEFFKSTLSCDEDILMMQEIFGYILLDHCKFKKGFMFIGDGDNGKSVTIDLLSAMLGKENISNVSLHSIDTDPFAVSELFGKYANINADIGKGKLEETGMLKNLIAGDQIAANRKFLTQLKFRNKAKMIFAANSLPETEDETDGFFTRWSIIEFPYSFKVQDEYDSLSVHDIESGKYKLAEKDILKKLTTQDEMSALLNWSLKGLHRLLQNKDFTNSSTVHKMKQFWLKRSSSMKAFIMDKVDFTYNDSYILTEDLHFEYIKYCKENNLKPQMKKDCTKILETNPIKRRPKKFTTGAGTMQKWIWEGLRLK